MVKFWEKTGKTGTYISDDERWREYIKDGIRYEKKEKTYNERGEDKNGKVISLKKNGHI